jgi:NAD+-dependent protein deacetylase SIR2
LLKGFFLPQAHQNRQTMEAPSWEPPSKRRKAEQVLPAPIAKGGLQDAVISTTAEKNDQPSVKFASIATSSDQCHILCSQYSADLETALPITHGGQTFEESQKPPINRAEFTLDSKLKLCRTHANGPSHHQAHGKGNEDFTYEEALAIRYHARELGLDRFFDKCVIERRIPLRKLCAAFGTRLPTVLEDPPESGLLLRLKKAIVVDMGNRIKLQKYNSVDDAISLVHKAKNIMLITGAGISTSLSIPDFRSRGGLYSKLREMGFEDPESVFSRDTFEQDPQPFFSVASMILPPGDGRFTPTHAFLRLLQDNGKLLSLYTQNIDGIDLTAGIRRDKLLQLHGSFQTATCTRCGHRVKGEEIFPEIRKGEVPNCAECAKERQIRIDQIIATRAQNGRSVRRKTQRSSVDSTSEPAGIMRPDIVFMGELPKPYLKRFKRDCTQVDLVIVMGTSLPVEPVSSMPNRVPPRVPQIYVGKNQMYPERNKKIDFDIQLLGECDVVAEMLAKGCGWDLKHEMLPKDTIIEVEPWCGIRHCHLILREKVEENRKHEKTEPEP